MHWGVRRAAKGSAGEKRNQTLAEIKKVQQRGKEKRSLEADKFFEKKLDNILALSEKKVSEINASSSPKIVKFLKKLKLDNKDGDAIIKAVHETDKFQSDRAKAFSKEKKAKLKAAEDRIFDKYDKIADQIFKEKIDKLPFPRSMIESVKEDRKLNDKMMKELLDAELAIEKELNR
jgi:hypothetical protein